MKLFGLALFVCLVSLRGQSLPNLPDETVVATFDDGVKLTMGDFKRIYAILPPDNQKQAIENRQQFLREWGLMRKLARMAEEDKLDQLSPSKESLEYNRLVILSQAKMSQQFARTEVLPSQVADYYEKNKDRYRQVKVKAIYIAFGGQKRTEADAKSKAAKLAAQARAGADFAKLARENSDDETSRAKDGDFTTLHPNDNVPDAVRDAVFRLKEGEISEPVLQPNGYYLFRAQEISYRPFAEVRDEIFGELKQKLFKDWIDKTNSEAGVKYDSMPFIGAMPLTAPFGAGSKK